MVKEIKNNLLNLLKHPLFVGIITFVLTYLFSPSISSVINNGNTNIINNFGNPNESVYICDQFEETNIKKIENISNLFNQIEDLNNLTISKDNEIKICDIKIGSKEKEISKLKGSLAFLEDDFKDLNESYYELKNKGNEISDFFTGYEIPLPMGSTVQKDNMDFTLYYDSYSSISGTIVIYVNGVYKSAKRGQKINFDYSKRNYNLNLLRLSGNNLLVSIVEVK